MKLLSSALSYGGTFLLGCAVHATSDAQAVLLPAALLCIFGSVVVYILR